MIPLPNVTLVIADTVNYGQAINAIQKSLREIKPARAIFFTDIVLELPEIDVITIPHFYNKKAYSKWMMKELGKQDITTSHILVIQHDGFVLDGSAWDDAYLEYDYVGAPWLETDGFNVGNGGFSLRSMKLHRALAEDNLIKGRQPEDAWICRVYRDGLEEDHQIKFAPDVIAHKFSYELHEPKDKTFGFHGNFHPPYMEPIVIKRTAALGDVIQVEPILDYFHQLGHPVYLDTLPGFYQIFGLHSFKVGDYSKFDKNVIKHRVINLDLAYEVNPAQLHLKSYFDFAGIADYVLRNPRLNYHVQDENRLFRRYVVIHIDRRETTHRNVLGVDWKRVAHNLEDRGFTVIQIGKGEHEDCGLYFNTVNEQMMLWLIAGCELFVGIDSGPSHMAVATGRKCVLFFGSVNPKFIHYDLSSVEVLQSPCPFETPNCWHLTTSTRGQDCPEIEAPPCTMHSTRDVALAIDRILKR